MDQLPRGYNYYVENGASRFSVISWSMIWMPRAKTLWQRCVGDQNFLTLCQIPIANFNNLLSDVWCLYAAIAGYEAVHSCKLDDHGESTNIY